MNPEVIAAPPAWTRIYWPASVAISVALFISGSYVRLTGPALAAGVILIVPVETWFLVHRQWSATLSDWTWRVLDVTRGQPVSAWKAQHFLALAAYLAVAVRTDAYLWHLGWWPFAAGAGISVWLTWHLFGRWWR
ncbi:MAG: hypothetical protein ACYCO9_16410 [Streptosporangiaceae bacterium]